MNKMQLFHTFFILDMVKFNVILPRRLLILYRSEANTKAFMAFKNVQYFQIYHIDH